MKTNICHECKKFEKIMTPLIIDIENNIKMCCHILSDYIIDESRFKSNCKDQHIIKNVVK